MKKISLHKIDRVMCENNFDLFNFQEFVYSKDYQIKWFDMLYVNKKFKQKLASTKSIANNF